MSVTVTLTIEREFVVAASQEFVFEVLADVPYSVSHFPKVRHLENLGDGVYRWKLEAIAAAGIRHETVYACRYVSDESEGTVVWTPIDSVGNGVITGAWQISRDGDGTRIAFRTDAELEIPAPGLLTPIVASVVREIFTGLIREYIRNLRRTFENQS